MSVEKDLVWANGELIERHLILNFNILFSFSLNRRNLGTIQRYVQRTLHES